MSNEIWHSGDDGEVFYALIFRKSDNKIWDGTNNTFTDYADADIDDYEFGLTPVGESGPGFAGYHVEDFPSAIPAGVYRVQVLIEKAASIGYNGESEYYLSRITGKE